ncbi:MAG: hypothetical protein DI536_09965 [Archangium gephyra]|uniref:Outer membrane protein beta-barrel domain-containing protein n=1 Tax=Archangium gephyra TaxID=48 RepID=A0A2W5TFR7_9BACT|nr:MAG: hypothetical protein DI536_09965 [Archangium gephyra]
MRTLLLGLTLTASSVFAQAPEPAQTQPPLVPIEEARPLPPQEPPPVDVPVQNPSYFDRCFAVPGMVWIPVPSGGYYSVNPRITSSPLSSFHGAAPVTSTPATNGNSGSSGGSGGGGDIGKAVLILAVVAVAVLPIIVYAADSDAPAVVEQRFHCPTFGIDLMGGGDFNAIGAGGSGMGRFNFGWSYFGTDVQYEIASNSTRTFAGHVMVRFGPKNHIEPALAAGYRNMMVGGEMVHGIEVGVPHRYVFWREQLRSFGLELRPTILFGLGSLEGGLEGALFYSIAEPFQVRLGGRFHSFKDTFVGGVNAGVSFVF